MGIMQERRGGATVGRTFLEYSAQRSALEIRDYVDGAPVTRAIPGVYGQLRHVYLYDPMHPVGGKPPRETAGKAPKKLTMVLRDKDEEGRPHDYYVQVPIMNAADGTLTFAAAKAATKVYAAATLALNGGPDTLIQVRAFEAPKKDRDGKVVEGEVASVFMVRGGSAAKMEELRQAGEKDEFGILKEVFSTAISSIYGFKEDGTAIDQEPDDWSVRVSPTKSYMVGQKLLDLLAPMLDHYQQEMQQRIADAKSQREAGTDQEVGHGDYVPADDEIPADEASSLAREGQRG